MSGQIYRDLKVWQRSLDLVVQVYRLTNGFPRAEQFGLTNQIRRLVVSVAANIAEGHGRRSKADFLRFLNITRGSLSETETHLLIASRLDYTSHEDLSPVWTLSQEVGRLLNGLIRSLSQEISSSNRILEPQETYDADPDYRLPTTDYRLP